MGYLHNHLATVVSAAFAIVLTGLWVVMVPIFPILDFIFMMAVPIMWFIVFMCWIVQKGADYSHHLSSKHIEKKTPSSTIKSNTQLYTAEGKTV